MQEYGQKCAKTIENQVMIAYNDRNEEENNYKSESKTSHPGVVGRGGCLFEKSAVAWPPDKAHPEDGLW